MSAIAKTLIYHDILVFLVDLFCWRHSHLDNLVYNLLQNTNLIKYFYVNVHYGCLMLIPWHFLIYARCILLIVSFPKHISSWSEVDYWLSYGQSPPNSKLWAPSRKTLIYHDILVLVVDLFCWRHSHLDNLVYNLLQNTSWIKYFYVNVHSRHNIISIF